MHTEQQTPAPRPLHCQMRNDCTAAVTHIGSKGYVYCANCAVVRRQSNSAERCRKMRKWEIATLSSGGVLPSYEPKKRAVPHV